MRFGLVQSRNGHKLIVLAKGSRNRGVAVSEKPSSSFVTFRSDYAKRISQYDGENRQ